MALARLSLLRPRTRSCGRGRDGPSPEGSGRPPHGSQRAGLPHWALASGANVKALIGPGMHDASWREPAPHVPIHALPVQAVSLAPTPQRAVPVAGHLGPEGAQRMDVGWDAV